MAKESIKEKVTKLIDIEVNDLASLKIMAEENNRSVKAQIESMIKQQIKCWDKKNGNYPVDIVTNEYENDEFERLHEIANVKWVK